MPIKAMTPELRAKMGRRALNFGPPNSRKTTAILSSAYYPLQIVSFPGEMGWATIPDGVNGLSSYVWEEAPGDTVTADSMRREVEDTVFQIIAGKRGPCRTLALEGFHKLYDVYLNVATSGSFGRGDDFEAQRYGRAHQMASSFLRKVLSSPVEYVIMTTWNAPEADKAGVKGGESHEWPDLPGRMSKLVVGMFSLVVYSKLTPALKDGRQVIVPEWLIAKDSEVWGASLKVDPRLAAKLPPKVSQNWKGLYELIGAAEKEVESEGEPLLAEKVA